LLSKFQIFIALLKKR